MRRVAISLIFLLLVVPSFAAQSIVGKAIKVADGDTITVLDANKQQHRGGL